MVAYALAKDPDVAKMLQFRKQSKGLEYGNDVSWVQN
jgi:hypothetical protein